MVTPYVYHPSNDPLNESPSEKEGKSRIRVFRGMPSPKSLNESPSEKEGKLNRRDGVGQAMTLNESPSEKEGKFHP